jgi:hypothetical protein
LLTGAAVPCVQATSYLNKLPAQFQPDDLVLIADPMLATGGTMMQVRQPAMGQSLELGVFHLSLRVWLLMSDLMLATGSSKMHVWPAVVATCCCTQLFSSIEHSVDRYSNACKGALM